MSDSKPALPEPTAFSKTAEPHTSQSSTFEEPEKSNKNIFIIIGVIITVGFILILLRKHLSKIFKRPLKQIKELDNREKLV